jgi:hypothetical protein
VGVQAPPHNTEGLPRALFSRGAVSLLSAGGLLRQGGREGPQGTCIDLGFVQAEPGPWSAARYQTAAGVGVGAAQPLACRQGAGLLHFHFRPLLAAAAAGAE